MRLNLEVNLKVSTPEILEIVHLVQENCDKCSKSKLEVLNCDGCLGNNVTASLFCLQYRCGQPECVSNLHDYFLFPVSQHVRLLSGDVQCFKSSAEHERNQTEVIWKLNQLETLPTNPPVTLHELLSHFASACEPLEVVGFWRSGFSMWLQMLQLSL